MNLDTEKLDHWFRVYSNLGKIASPVGDSILNKGDFAKVLKAFFDITLDPMVFGNLIKELFSTKEVRSKRGNEMFILADLLLQICENERRRSMELNYGNDD